MMMRALRTAQTYFPGIRTAKFGAYNYGTKYLGWPIEPELRILRALSGVGLAVDVGGNWGQSILALQHSCAPRQIISFEPNPELARRLKQTFGADAAVEIRNQGVSDGPGTLTLHIPSYNGYVFDGLASLDYDQARGWLNPERMIGFDESRLTIDKVDVDVISLDQVHLSPDILKIDVQGLEEKVLRGAIATLRRSEPITVIEAASLEVVALLADMGLSPFSVVAGRLLAGQRGTVNTMFLSRARQQAFAHLMADGAQRR